MKVSKSLFDCEYNRYTEEAVKFGAEINSVVQPVFKKYVDIGYNPRELEYIMYDEISLLSKAYILSTASKKITRK